MWLTVTTLNERILKMAYVPQSLKKKLAPAIKAVLKKYGVQGSIAVRHHSTLVVNLRKGKLDLKENPNVYWLESHYEGEVLSFYKELKEAMNNGNFDKSDIQSDYFHVGWYTDINVGKWDKPYEFIG